MKKFVFILIVLFCFFLCACEEKQEDENTYNQENNVNEELNEKDIDTFIPDENEEQKLTEEQDDNKELEPTEESSEEQKELNIEPFIFDTEDGIKRIEDDVYEKSFEEDDIDKEIEYTLKEFYCNMHNANVTDDSKKLTVDDMKIIKYFGGFGENNNVHVLLMKNVFIFDKVTTEYYPFDVVTLNDEDGNMKFCYFKLIPGLLEHVIVINLNDNYICSLQKACDYKCLTFSDMQIISSEYNKLAKDIDLKESILGMSIDEIYDFSSEYNGFEYCNYLFIDYDENTDVVIKLSRDCNKIASVNIYHNSPFDSDVISKIEFGMTVNQVIELIGNPTETFTSGIISLAFENDEATINIQFIDDGEDLIVLYVKTEYKDDATDTPEIGEHEHEYIDGVCDCGVFSGEWLEENFKLEEETVYFSGSVDDKFTDNIIIVVLKNSRTYPILTERHFLLKEDIKLEHLFNKPTRPKEYTDAQWDNYLDNYHQFVFIHIKPQGKEHIIELIKQIEQLPFVLYAGPDYLYELCD